MVEDEAIVWTLITAMLEELGYAALEIIDGPWPQGAPVRSSIGLLITDVRLPALNGRQLAYAAREIRPGLKVLFIASYAGNAVVGNGVLFSGMEIMPKPFAMYHPAGKIRKMMERV